MYGIIWTDFTNILFSSPSMVESLTKGLPKVPKGFPEVKKCNYQYSEKVQLRVWLAEENAKQTTSLWGCACQPGRDLKRPFIKIFGELVQCVKLMYFWHRSKKRKRFEWDFDHFWRNLSWIGPVCDADVLLTPQQETETIGMEKSSKTPKCFGIFSKRPFLKEFDWIFQCVTLMYFWHHSKKRKQLEWEKATCVSLRYVVLI